MVRSNDDDGGEASEERYGQGDDHGSNLQRRYPLGRIGGQWVAGGHGVAGVTVGHARESLWVRSGSNMARRAHVGSDFGHSLVRNPVISTICASPMPCGRCGVPAYKRTTLPTMDATASCGLAPAAAKKRVPAKPAGTAARITSWGVWGDQKKPSALGL